MATFEGEIGDLRLKVQEFWGFGVLGSSFLKKIVKNDKKSMKRIQKLGNFRILGFWGFGFLGFPIYYYRFSLLKLSI